MEIEIQNRNFVLHPSGAVFWADKSLLLISDVHLGKVSHFRKHGVAVPSTAVMENFTRLTSVVAYFNPEKVLFLGDLFHSTKNQEWQLFVEWINCCVSDVLLIAGNHDILGEKIYNDIGIKVADSIQIDDFLLTHHPTVSDGLFNFAGHIHPGILLKGRGGQSEKLPCFFQTENQMILPAFGEFTGKHMMKPDANTIVYAIANNDIVRLKKA